MIDDYVAVTDGLCSIQQVGQLPMGRGVCVQDVAMLEFSPAQLQERIDLQAERVVIDYSEQFRVGIECQHGRYTSALIDRTAIVAGMWRNTRAPPRLAKSACAFTELEKYTVGSSWPPHK